MASSTSEPGGDGLDLDAVEIRVATPEQDLASRHRVGEREYVRDAAPGGLWRYATSGIPVPGARDLTAQDRFRPRRALDADGEPAEFIVDVQRLETTVAELEWLHDIGSVVSDREGRVTAVIVAAEEWREQSTRLCGLSAPEIDGSPVERELAEAERRARIAAAIAERATAERNRLLHAHADALTRRRAAEIVGLSAARVQQLLDRGPVADALEPERPAEPAPSANWWSSR